MSPLGPLIVRPLGGGRQRGGVAMAVTRAQVRCRARAARGASPPGRTTGTHKKPNGQFVATGARGV